MSASSTDLRNAALLLGGVFVARVVLGASWDLLADEAWYLAWSRALDFGYYDQPPLIAWVLAAEVALLGESSLALRAVPLLCGLLVPLALLAHVGERAVWLAWCALLPPLAWLTVFATPDAPLLAAWAVGLAGASHGGRGWLVAGLAAGVAFQAKHTGALLFPLLCLGAREDLRDRWLWAGGGLALFIAAPNLAWNVGHDWVTVRFQATEGLAHPNAPGPVGALAQLGGQLAVATPIVAVTGYTWCAANLRLARGEGSRIERLAWWTSAPLLLGFALAGGLAPADAHWPAPAWIGVGVGLSYQAGRWRSAVATGLGLAAALTAAGALHSVMPLGRWTTDPGTRLTEGPILAAMVSRAVASGEAAKPVAVYTERYQEAAFIQHYAKLNAIVHPGCGRRGQQDLWRDDATTSRAVFVRPTTGGPPHCILEEWEITRGPIPLHAADPYGRPVGPWQLFELQARP